MADDLLEIRRALAPLIGRRVAVAGLFGRVSRNGKTGRPVSLVMNVESPDLGRVGWHVWVQGADFRAAGVPLGHALRFEAEVTTYRTHSFTEGREVARYGLARPTGVGDLGPVELAEIVRWLTEGWGWEAVADAVAAAGGDPQTGGPGGEQVHR